MNEFLKLNQHKIKFGLKWTSIIFTTIFLALFTWGVFRGQIPEWSLALTVVLTAGIVFPFFIMTLGTLQEFLVYRKTKKILGTYPFSELTKFGFQTGFANENSKWTLTQLKLKGQFNDYPMEAEMENSNFKLIAFVNLDKVTKDHIRHLKKDLGDKRIEMDWLGVSLRYDTSRERLTSFEQIKYDLKRLTDYLNTEQLQLDDESGSA
ncbi:hypothetical protein BH10BAC4_BH10BAC4_12340 [soil metagenome]